MRAGSGRDDSEQVSRSVQAPKLLTHRVTLYLLTRSGGHYAPRCKSRSIPFVTSKGNDIKQIKKGQVGGGRESF